MGLQSAIIICRAVGPRGTVPHNWLSSHRCFTTHLSSAPSNEREFLRRGHDLVIERLDILGHVETSRRRDGAWRLMIPCCVALLSVPVNSG